MVVTPAGTVRVCSEPVYSKVSSTTRALAADVPSRAIVTPSVSTVDTVVPAPRGALKSLIAPPRRRVRQDRCAALLGSSGDNPPPWVCRAGQRLITTERPRAQTNGSTSAKHWLDQARTTTIGKRALEHEP